MPLNYTSSISVYLKTRRYTSYIIYEHITAWNKCAIDKKKEKIGVILARLKVRAISYVIFKSYIAIFKIEFSRC